MAKGYSLVVGTSIFQGSIPGMVPSYPHALEQNRAIEGSSEVVNLTMISASILNVSVGPSTVSQSWDVSNYNGPQPAEPWVAVDADSDAGRVKLTITEG